MTIKNNEKWQPFVFLAHPPDGAGRLKFFCFATGIAEFVYFDDIGLQELDAKGLTKPLSLTQGSCRVVLDNRGILRLFQGPRKLIHKGMLRITQQKRVSATQKFAIGKRSQQDGQICWQGSLHVFGEKQDLPLKIECKNNTDGIVLALSLDMQPSSTRVIKYVFTGKDFYSSRKIKFRGDNGFVDGLDNMPPAIHQMIWALPGIQRQIGFFYERPCRCVVVKDANGIHFRHHIDLNGKKRYTFRMKIKTSFSEDVTLLRQWQNLAEKYEQAGQPGQASLYYQKILDNFSFHPDTEKIQLHLSKLQQVLQNDIIQTLKLLKKARFFDNLASYELAALKCRQEQIKWKGLPGAEKLAKIFTEVRAESSKLRKVKSDRICLRLLKRAQDLEHEQYPALALLFYREIVDHYPNNQVLNLADNRIKLLKKRVSRKKMAEGIKKQVFVKTIGRLG